MHPEVKHLKRCGQKLVLTVRAIGACSYKWIKDCRFMDDTTLVNCTGASTDTLKFTCLAPQHSGLYKCQVSGSTKSVRSGSAKLEGTSYSILVITLISIFTQVYIILSTVLHGDNN